MRFRVLDARNPTDAEEWRAVCHDWARWEVFADPGYVRLFAGERDEPLAAVATTDSGGLVVYPFVLRRIESPSGRPMADVTSPWGGGGPYQQGMSDTDAKEFWSLFDDYCRRRHVVSEFVRLHVLPEDQLPYPGTVTPRLTQVVRDLDPPVEQLWREFEHKVRKNVNKARRGGVTIEVDETGAGLDQFLGIYLDTMRRRRAAAAYHFPRSFFERLIRDLAGRYAFFHARHAGRVVSTELVLISAESIYSYLGGTEATAFDLRPNDLLKFEIIRWGQRTGRRRFILGAGSEPNDGIFRYKRAFAPHGLVTYALGSRVLDEPAYRRLTAEHVERVQRRLPGWRPDPAFFPAYRQEPKAEPGPDPESDHR